MDSARRFEAHHRLSDTDVSFPSPRYDVELSNVMLRCLASTSVKGRLRLTARDLVDRRLLSSLRVVVGCLSTSYFVSVDIVFWPL